MVESLLNLKLLNFKLPKNTQKKIILNLGCEGISKCSKIVLDTKILNFWATKTQFGFYPKHEKMAIVLFCPFPLLGRQWPVAYCPKHLDKPVLPQLSRCFSSQIYQSCIFCTITVNNQQATSITYIFLSHLII